MSKWTKEETLELVKLYKSHPELWNKYSDLYRNKQAREGALLSILSKMGPGKFKSAQDVKIKLNNLRDTYLGVLKKKVKLEREGLPYQPTLSWFNEFQGIMDTDRLEPVKQEPDSDNNISDENVLEYSEPTSTSSAITCEYIETTADEQNTQYVVSQLTPQAIINVAPIALKRIKLEEDDSLSCQLTPQASINVAPIPLKRIKLEDDSLSCQLTPQASINVAPIPFKRIKLEEHDKDIAGPSHDMRRQEKEAVNNEFQMFADKIEEELRKLEDPLDKDDMSTSKWTNEETLKLVKLYKSYPDLWNKTSESYRNKEVREGALLSIMSKMGTDKFKSAKEVKDKLNSLRTIYHQVLKKIAKWEKKGSLYIPKFSWFNEFREIVDAGLVEQTPVINNLSDEINLEYSEPTSTSNAITSECIETMPDEENTQYVVSQLTSQATINVAPISLNRIKLEIHDKDSAGPSHDMRGQEKETVNDEFQMFADNIAEQLRKLPLDRALKIQLAIQSIIAEERTQLYKKSMREAHE